MSSNTDSIIGRSVPRIDAPAKVTGQALYPGDITMPGVLFMATLFAGRPHARIRAIDIAAAEAEPGVVSVFTAKDVPVNEYGLQMPDQPVLCGPGSSKPGTDIVRFVGDQVALVVAESETQARAAMGLVTIDWEDLPLVLDAEAAMQPGAYQLHPHAPGNITYQYRIRKGDAASALAPTAGRPFGMADVVVEGVYETPVQEHAYLQPEAGISYIDEQGRITVAVAGQWTHVDAEQIAHALDLPKERVRRDLPGYRRRVRRTRRYVGADHVGALRLAAGTTRDLSPGTHPVEPGGIDLGPWQAPRHEGPDVLGRGTRWQADSSRGPRDRRWRRLLLHQ